jgi:hypothetical protein
MGRPLQEILKWQSEGCRDHDLWLAGPGTVGLLHQSISALRLIHRNVSKQTDITDPRTNASK